MKTLTLYYVGHDRQGRPTYIGQRSHDSRARVYIDADSRAWIPARICAVDTHDLEAPAFYPISESYTLEFVPKRQTRQLVGPMQL